MKKIILGLLAMLGIMLLVVSCSGPVAGEATASKVCDGDQFILKLDVPVTVNYGTGLQSKVYAYKLDYITSTQAKLTVNNEVTNKIEVGKSYTLKDGTGVSIVRIFGSSARVCVNYK
ncbi:hypothetical protein HYX11_01200 [Candidatus Woesearchaeota archaeon]|nr:hypothetical protein [Candidatus Woesearchaeota archaeon]